MKLISTLICVYFIIQSQTLQFNLSHGFGMCPIDNLDCNLSKEVSDICIYL